MNNAWQMLHSRRGSALITGLMVMIMVSMLGASYLTFTTTNLMRASRDERRTTTFYLAEAGLESVIAQITTAAETNGGIIVSQTYNTTSELNALHSGSIGIVTVVADTGGKTATITSAATYRSIAESIRIRLKLKNVGIWNCAIFAGIGQSGRGINGNVDIRGSVHILGEGDPYSDLNGNGTRDLAESYTDSNSNGVYDPGEPYTDTDGNGIWSDVEPYQDDNLNGMYDPPLTATDLAGSLSGNAYIGNNYTDMPVTLQNKIPALEAQLIGGENVYTLNAELRVKHGKVNISGSASAGSPNVTGNSVKETLDGTYVSDGWGGSAGASQVYSDNGSTNGYDIGDRISFPSLLDAYTDPNTGIQYSTYEAYLDAHSLEVPVSLIDETVSDFTYTDGTNSISWDESSETLTVTGIIRFAGDLDLSTKGETIYFSGSGTLFSKNDVRVHGSVMPRTMFPTTDALGCIAKRDIQFATGAGESQLYAAGAWYAQRKIVSAKQNQFAGTYVSNYFDMGTNVPNIYQVPELANNLPPGMPGADVNVVVVHTLSWKHL